MTDTPKTQRDLASMISSRICHDLISPLGAIGNGMEFLMMAGQEDSPELTLINDSVASANARIRLFRVAFGAASPTAMVSRTETASILTGAFADARFKLNWLPDVDLPRTEVKLAFLVLQCFEKALPYGGDLVVQQKSGQWMFEAKAEKLRFIGSLWAQLMGRDDGEAVEPANVQFLMAPVAAAQIGRTIHVAANDTQIQVSF